jgi:hypothetical protein
LDIGAGDGKVLQAFRTWALDRTLPAPDPMPLWAIEKSEILREELGGRGFKVLASDLFTTDLDTIKADITFCNPPFHEFELWAEKILRTSPSPEIFLVLPKVWQGSVRIAAATQNRTMEVLGETDFCLAEERPARVVAEIIHSQKIIPANS